MKRWLESVNVKYVVWLLCLLVFWTLMGDRYCRMAYGGDLLYVLTGRNKISEAERQWLEDRAPLVYGDSLDSFPAQLRDPSLEGQNGFAVDLAEQLSWELGAEIRFQPVLWPEVFERLESGELDLIQVSYSPRRAREYYLTAPIYRNRGVVFMENDGTKIRALSELQGRRLAGIGEDYALLVLREKCPGLEILEYPDLAGCAEALRDGQVDGIVADEQNLMYYIQGERLFQKCYMVEENVYEADVVFAVRKSDETLGRLLDKAVYGLRNKDRLNEIQQKWFLTSVLEDALPRKRLYLWGTALGIGTAAFFLCLFWIIHTGTRTLVQLRTRELEQERGRIRTILDSLPQALVEIAPGGQILMANRQAEREIARERLPFLGEGGLDLTDPELERLLEEQGGRVGAQREVESGGRWYRLTCSQIQEEQLKENRILLAEEITLARLQEKKNAQNEKMIAIGQLASGISHELKNPLEIICNYCYALKNGLFASTEELKESVQVIEEEAAEANRIVESLLSFARESPKETKGVQLKPILEMILRLEKSLLKKRGIQVTLTCEEGLWVLGNPDGIKTVVVNLLTNAMEAMEEGRERRIGLSAGRCGEAGFLDVQDTGKGMGPEEVEKIFNPFYTTKASGTGLGLYLVYQQLQEIGGSIQAQSRVGEGTLFHIELPLYHPEAGKKDGEERRDGGEEQAEYPGCG